MLTYLAPLSRRRIEVYSWVNEKVISLVLRCTIPVVFLDCFTPSDSIDVVLAPSKARTRANPYSPLNGDWGSSQTTESRLWPSIKAFFSYRLRESKKPSSSATLPSLLI